MNLYELYRKSGDENSGGKFRVYYVRTEDDGEQVFGFALITEKNGPDAESWFLDNVEDDVEVVGVDTFKRGEVYGPDHFDLPLMTPDELKQFHDEKEPNPDKFNPHSWRRPAQ